MTNFDLLKDVDFYPLERLGVSKEDGIKYLIALSPFIDLEFQSKIKSAFSQGEMEEIGKEAESRGIKPEDGLFFLEEKYYKKTSKYFMEEMRLLFNEYVKYTANILSQARQDIQTFVSEDRNNYKKFDDLIKNKNWEDAAKFLDKVLTDKTITPQQ